MATTTILCGIDNSTLAPRVARVAGDLAALLDARLILLNAPQQILDAPAYERGAPVPDPPEQLVLNAQSKVLLDAVAEDAGLLDVSERRVAPGHPPERLLGEAIAEGASCIVVGSRGHGPARSALLGSVSADVVRHASCPVVVVPRTVPA